MTTSKPIPTVTTNKRFPIAVRLVIAAAIIVAVVEGSIRWLGAELASGLATALTLLWWFWSAPVVKIEKIDG